MLEVGWVTVVEAWLFAAAMGLFALDRWLGTRVRPRHKTPFRVRLGARLNVLLHN